MDRRGGGDGQNLVCPTKFAIRGHPSIMSYFGGFFKFPSPLVQILSSVLYLLISEFHEPPSPLNSDIFNGCNLKFPVLKVYYLAAEVIVRKNKIFSTNYFLHAVIVIVLTE